jgi:hypothetical protein
MKARDNNNANDNDNGAPVPTWDPARRAFVWRPFEPWPNHTRTRTEAPERWRTCARKFWHERDNAQTGAPRSPLIDEQARALATAVAKERRAQAKLDTLAHSYRTGAASMLASMQTGKAVADAIAHESRRRAIRRALAPAVAQRIAERRQRARDSIARDAIPKGEGSE